MVKPGMYINDRYEIIEKIGSGGMADVYKAKCHRLDRYVAIKILKQEYSDDKNFITKFRGEAQSAAGLSHPNIVSVYDVGDDEGLYYIVMELVEGITLKKFIEKKGRLDIKEAVGITIQIAQGMEAAHNKHIIHRDIKPQNIMISREGKVKVTDFGIAKAATGDTYSQNAIGSVHYLSPEQARGGYCDEKSDIYSLGVTLYEMLSGTLPFAAENNVSVALQHINTEAQPVRELVPSVPFSLDRIVQKCMQKRPENRYLHVSELIVDLKRSITNPDGDFVRMPLSGYVPDNPTRKFTQDEVDEIKSGAAGAAGNRQDVRRTNEMKKRDKRNRHVLREEEEELDSINSTWEKVIIVISIIFAIGLTIGIIFLAGRFFGIGEFFNPTPTPVPTPSIPAEDTPTPSPTEVPVQTISMPRLFGYTFEDAEKLMKQKSNQFNVILAGEEYSDQPRGTVIGQYPNANSDVLLDATIRLTISAGPEPLEVPFVNGMTQEQATMELIDRGIQVVPSFEPSEDIEEGKVIRTEPAAGQTILAGDILTIVISTGKNVVYVDMINIVGMTVAEAHTALSMKGLSLGVITEEHSEIRPAGEILRQSIKLEETVASGTRVDVVVSLGPVFTPLPTETPVPELTPELTPGAELTPGPSGAPVMGEPYYEVLLDTEGKENPIPEGKSLEYFIEILQGDSWYELTPGGAMLGYDQYPAYGFTFRLPKSEYPDLQNGTAYVYMYLWNESSGMLTLQDEWVVELQELAE